ncbi:nucleoside hydrolase [Myceligenerans pegani]|uniref:Nucleoside hydrolase n=1 Tax=Myceligenerans pegani TaxID=2776917 RepID=A0ABR9N112_9MICO|nr:nucleoside hydrolase [Myceligenerans sp. TRM 65318]MBE1877348.1 nucleoside hydrolase [Myceligenerans sp. TRM 65318]MBE3019619.1 nucleoside hydrolase [Myceligenerans sp. TRM 65318]
MVVMEPVPVIYDSDMDFDDASTLAYLCRAHQRGLIDLRAVTVVDNGIGTPGRTLTHARTLLRGCGLADVPVGAGTDEWVNEPPPEARASVEIILSDVLGDADVPHEPARVTAPALIAATVERSRQPVTILATGPLSNVAAALDRMGPHAVDRRLGRVFAMAGAVDVGGNLFGSTTEGFDNTQEVNAWIDPPATARTVGGVPDERLRLVGLDATNHVPVTDAFVARLAAERDTHEARLVHAIVTHPEVVNLKELGALYWWDPLAAVSLVTGEGVVFETRTLDVVTTGASAGRTVDVPGGTPQRVGVSADPPRFEDLFLAGLNGR